MSSGCWLPIFPSMTVAYSILGIAAALGQKLSRCSINFIQLNWIAMLALGFFVAFGTDRTNSALTNREGARKHGVVDGIREYDAARNFVTVRGTLFPVTLFKKAETHRSGTETVQFSFLPLVDVDSGTTLLMRVPGRHEDREEPIETQVTGLLIPMETGLRSVLQKTGGKVEDLQVNTQLVLAADETPGSPWMWGGATAMAAAVLLAMLTAWRKRYVVFQHAPEHAAAIASPSDSDDERGIDLRATGRFRLDAKNRARFLNVPAGVARLSDNRLAVVCNVDASTRFMGVTTRQRQGTWAAGITPEDLTRVERGFQYAGWRRRPALRVPCRDITTGREETILLSCADEVERRSLERQLVKMVEAGSSEPAPAREEELVEQS